MASGIGSADFNATVAELVLDGITPTINSANASFVLTSGYVRHSLARSLLVLGRPKISGSRGLWCSWSLLCSWASHSYVPLLLPLYVAEHRLVA